MAKTIRVLFLALVMLAGGMSTAKAQTAVNLCTPDTDPAECAQKMAEYERARAALAKRNAKLAQIYVELEAVQKAADVKRDVKALALVGFIADLDPDCEGDHTPLKPGEARSWSYYQLAFVLMSTDEDDLIRGSATSASPKLAAELSLLQLQWKRVTSGLTADENGCFPPEETSEVNPDVWINFAHARIAQMKKRKALKWAKFAKPATRRKARRTRRNAGNRTAVTDANRQVRAAACIDRHPNDRAAQIRCMNSRR